MLTARIKPALISPQAVSTRSLSGPGSAIFGIVAVKAIPSGPARLSFAVPIGWVLSCWCSSESGLVNFETVRGRSGRPAFEGPGFLLERADLQHRVSAIEHGGASS